MLAYHLRIWKLFNSIKERQKSFSKYNEDTKTVRRGQAKASKTSTLFWMLSLNSSKLSTEKTEDLKLMGLC